MRRKTVQIDWHTVLGGNCEWLCVKPAVQSLPCKYYWGPSAHLFTWRLNPKEAQFNVPFSIISKERQGGLQSWVGGKATEDMTLPSELSCQPIRYFPPIESRGILSTVQTSGYLSQCEGKSQPNRLWRDVHRAVDGSKRKLSKLTCTHANSCYAMGIYPTETKLTFIHRDWQYAQVQVRRHLISVVAFHFYF